MRFYADAKDEKITVFKSATEINQGSKQTLYSIVLNLTPREALDLAEAILQGHQNLTNRPGKPVPTSPPGRGARTQTSRW